MGSAWLKRAAVALALTGGVAGAAWAIGRLNALPDGPVEIVWDREACAHCRMHVGEPSFAAQLQLVGGEVRSYDDPGCMLADLAKVPAAEVHAVWVHHVAEERWLRGEEAGFVGVPVSPMGYGLGAVDKGAPRSVSLAAARAEVAAREARR